MQYLIVSLCLLHNFQDNSIQVLSDFVHIFSQLLRAQLPEKSIRIQTALCQFPSVCGFLIRLDTLFFYDCRIIFPHLIFLAFYTLKIWIKHWIIIGALTMNPSSAFITQNPLFTIIARVKVYLLAVHAISLFLVLNCAFVTQFIWIKDDVFIIACSWWIVFAFWTNFIYATLSRITWWWWLWRIWWTLIFFLYFAGFTGFFGDNGCVFLENFGLRIGRVWKLSIGWLWTFVDHWCLQCESLDDLWFWANKVPL